jgi:release factor glutamine methyltransferase
MAHLSERRPVARFDHGSGDVAMTVRDALRTVSAILGSAGVRDAALEARVMVRETTGLSAETLLAEPERWLSQRQAHTLSGWLTRRLRREPLQQITGHAWFYGRKFAVTPHVLVPRPETELLVEQALAFCRERGLRAPVIADIGTGSGALAVTLACEMPEARVIATDVSAAALEVARGNAESLEVAERVEFREGDLSGPLSERCDVVVCNPPYVLSGYLDGPDAQPELRFEPRGALDGGEDGMDVLRPLLHGLPGVLKASASAAFIEIDPPVAAKCVAEAKAALPGAQVSVLTDLAGLERCLVVEL